MLGPLLDVHDTTRQQQLQLYNYNYHYTTLHYTTSTTTTTTATAATTITTVRYTTLDITRLQYTTLHAVHCITLSYATLLLSTLQLQLQIQTQLQLQLHETLHYTNYTTVQYSAARYTTLIALHYTTSTTTLHYNYNDNCNYITPHYIQQLWVSWPLQPLHKAQLQPPFSPSLDSLCQPCITTTHLSYSFLSLKLPPPPCTELLVMGQIPGALGTLKF